MARSVPTVLALVLTAPLALGTDWPHPRGPEVSGRVAAPGTFEAGDVGLAVAWRVPLGSGYSGIAVADGSAVTMFADATGDWIAAFDAATGKQRWRQRLGDATRGRDGSDDGPLSSPVIGGDRVFALDPRGHLQVFRLADGAPVWSKQLTEAFGAAVPDFGFTTTPMLLDEVLVVEAGGSDGRTIVGLDVRSGERLWNYGSDGADYQSPTVMTLGGQRQIVAATNRRITGLDPRTGKQLWEVVLGDKDWVSSANPTFIGEDRFLVTMSGDFTAYRVTRSDEGFAVAELYRTNALGGNYAPPVYHDGHLYGFRGQILTCVQADNGERVWRSREPGGDGLILVQDRLVIFGDKGNVVIADASPAGYKERARVQALEGSALTWPSFATGRVFVRNLSELAAVAVTGGGLAQHAELPPAADHEFGRWVDKVRKSDDPRALIDEFWRQHERLPVLEGKYVHFVYRGSAQDVAVAGSMLESENADTLQRIPGTDFFYRSYAIEPGVRWEYQFQLDYETWATDPRNPRTVPAIEGEEPLSELVSGGYPLGSHFDEPQGTRGRVESFKLASKALEQEKEIKVWLPSSYGSKPLPVLVVNDGTAWLEKGQMANTLDNLVGKSVAPVIVAFVEPSRAWWREAGGSSTVEYARMLAEELVPELRKRYRVAEGAGVHGIMGNRFYAFTSAYTALKYPAVFGHVSVQSPYLGLGSADELEALIRAHSGPSTRFYADWNRYDERNLDRDWDFAADSRKLDELLRKNGYAVQGGEVLDSSGWGGWRNRADRVLVALFPAPTR